MLFRIVSVDRHGYEGRDFPPSKSDEGLIVSVVGLETFVFNGEGESVEPALAENVSLPVKKGNEVMITGQLAARDEIEGADGGFVFSRCWKVVTGDGRLLEVMDHEVELYQAGR